MKRLLIGRLGAVIPTMLLATFGIFALVKVAPGDPAVAMAGDNATAEQIAAIHQQLGLDRPLVVQYLGWLWDAVRGDLGTSFTTHVSVVSQIKQVLPITMQLVAGAMIVAVVLGVLAGVAASRRANSLPDTIVSAFAAAGAAMPSFWLGLVLIAVFAMHLGWLPATGYAGFSEDPGMTLRQLILPSIALGVAGAAEIARQLRAAMMDVLASDHVRTLRSKGVAERRIVWRHALKGSGVPLMTVVGLQISRFLGATVVVEAVFGISGIGSVVVTAAQNRDYPVVQGVVVVMAALVILTNVLVDLSYRFFDPRIR